MKKSFSLFVALVLILGLVASVAAADVKIGKAEYAAHGENCFTLAIVILEGDKIVDALLDEYQMLPKADTTSVPNANAGFGKAFANPEQGLASKRVNNDYYSALMANAAGSKMSLVDGWALIENYVIGKTISELEAIVASHDKEAMIDAVTGATLVDTKGYVEALLLAAYAALGR